MLAVGLVIARHGDERVPSPFPFPPCLHGKRGVTLGHRSDGGP